MATVHHADAQKLLHVIVVAVKRDQFLTPKTVAARLGRTPPSTPSPTTNAPPAKNQFTSGREEADLFKFLIRDLSTGGVIRQERDVNSLGQFVRKKPIKKRGTPTTLESAFEDTKPYVLTQLGRKFVHYTMNEAVTGLSQESSE